MKEDKIKEIIRQLIKELLSDEDELGESTQTGDTASYQIPAAFVGREFGKMRKQDWLNRVNKSIGYTQVADEEDADELGNEKKRSSLLWKSKIADGVIKEDKYIKSGFFFHNLSAGDKVKLNKTGKVLTLTRVGVDGAFGKDVFGKQYEIKSIKEISPVACKHIEETINKNQMFYIHDERGFSIHKIKGLDKALKYIKTLKFNAQLNYLIGDKYKTVYAHVVDNNRLSNQMGSAMQSQNIKPNKLYENIITEGRRGAFQIYRDDGSKNTQQKIGESIKRMRSALKELNREVNLNLRLKTESGIESNEYWKRTRADLAKVTEHIHIMLEKIRRF